METDNMLYVQAPVIRHAHHPKKRLSETFPHASSKAEKKKPFFLQLFISKVIVVQSFCSLFLASVRKYQDSSFEKAKYSKVILAYGTGVPALFIHMNKFLENKLKHVASVAAAGPIHENTWNESGMSHKENG